ncbi:MAG TPA: peptidoglycan bridge formation glycyltransferase FemA/FemB family protein [Pyrinomonadaceae bacterium]|nr:peptidoglycan bridge formation glycyltransferase FemA/FemB family protein [Pyrinomonadaceae bacterium]
MATWQLLSDQAAQTSWNRWLLQLDDYSPFQTYEWGEYQRALGWKPCRWAAFDDNGEIVAMMQGLMRRYPLNFGLIWSEGGPVGDLAVCDKTLHEAIKRTTGLKRIYCRFRCDRQRLVENSLLLSTLGWHRSWFGLTTSYSMRLNLAREESEVLAGCDRNWQRNLRRAGKLNLNIRQWTDPSVDEIVSVYSSMQSLKGLDEQYSRAEIENLLEHLKDLLVIYRAENEQGELVSLRGWLVVGDRATELLSATSTQGRELSASYALAWALVQHCIRLQIKSCDLGGIEPVVNPGVYKFKSGTGAAPIEYLGEWDWASSACLQWFGNWAISRRERLKAAEAAVKAATIANAKASFGEGPAPAKLSQPRTA